MRNEIIKLHTRLLEVGRKISKANATKLRAAMQEIMGLLSQIGESAALSEAERSFAERNRLLNAAIRDRLKGESDYTPYFYIADVFDGYFIYSVDSESYRLDYTIGDDGAVTLGATPSAVLPTMTYPPPPGEEIPALATEAALVSDCIPLTEASLNEAATANLKLIQPGWGSSGYYSPAVLRSAASTFKKGTKMFWDHQTPAEEAAKPEGSLANLAAELSEDAAYQDAGPAGPGLYAKAKVFDRFKDAVKDLRPSIGVSIRASGFAKPGEAEGRKGAIIERIATAKSVDFVTIPGAGGQILSLFESAVRRQPAIIPPVEEQQTMTEAEVKALQESNTAQATELARLREVLILSEARTFATLKLKAIDMPDLTRTRLAEQLVLRAPATKEGRLDEAAFTAMIEAAAKSEVEYLAAINGGVVRGVGGGAPPVPEVNAEANHKLLVQNLARLGGLSEAAAEVAAKGRRL